MMATIETSNFPAPSTQVRLTPRVLLPPTPPSFLISPPALPSPARATDLGNDFTLTTHILPAAYPRCSPDTPRPSSPPPDEGRQARQARIERTTKELVETKEIYEQACSEKANVGSETVHWTCINRYVRRAGTGGDRWTGRKSVTLFCVHPMGQHKETYEPMLRYLLEQAKYGSYEIDEIWSIDLVQHGDSGMLNASNMGSIYDHMDSVRDIANFLLHFLPEDGAGRLPTHLKCVSSDVTRRREKFGLGRRVVAVAHSQGASYMPLVAYHYPGIFYGMFLIDPVIYAPDADTTKRRTAFTKNLLSRRERWPSREEAYEALKKTAWGVWDDGVLRVYVESALADSDDQRGGVTLKCPSFLEAALHENMTSREAWMAIPLLNPTLPMHWILPTPEESFVPESLVEGPWRRPANAVSSCSIIAGGGHLIVQTKPREVAGELHKFLGALFSLGQRARL